MERIRSPFIDPIFRSPLILFMWPAIEGIKIILIVKLNEVSTIYYSPLRKDDKNYKVKKNWKWVPFMKLVIQVLSFLYWLCMYNCYKHTSPPFQILYIYWWNLFYYKQKKKTFFQSKLIHCYGELWEPLVVFNSTPGEKFWIDS